MADRRFWDPGCGRTRVKLCEVESLDAAVWLSALGADALGFHIFKKQDLESRAARFREIFPFVPPHVEKVLLTDVDFDDLVERVCGTMAVDAIQLYPDWDRGVVEELRRRTGCRILKVMSAQPSENSLGDEEFLERYAPVVDGFLLDSYRAGGTGKLGDWDICARIVARAPRPVFLAGGLTSDNVAAAIQYVRPAGVDVENGVSDRLPGGPLVKNPTKCRLFLEAVWHADAVLRG